MSRSLLFIPGGGTPAGPWCSAGVDSFSWSTSASLAQALFNRCSWKFIQDSFLKLLSSFLLEVTTSMVGRINSVYSLNQLILFDFLRWAHAHTDTRTHTDTQTHTVWNGPYLGYRSVCCFGSSDRTVKVLPRTPQGIQGKVTLWLGVDRARGKRPQGTQCYTLGVEIATPWGHNSICTQTHKHTHTHTDTFFS